MNGQALAGLYPAQKQCLTATGTNISLRPDCANGHKDQIFQTFSMMQRLIKMKVLIILLAWLYTGCSDDKHRGKADHFEVLNIGLHHASIVWRSQAPYKGRVDYVLSGSEEMQLSARQTTRASRFHHVRLMGLKPSSSYTYSIDKTGKRFRFKTKPTPGTAFSFTIIANAVSKKIPGLIMAQAPEFVVCLQWRQPDEADYLKSVRPYLPVFNFTGPDSILLEKTLDAPLKSNFPGYIDWGGLRLYFINRAPLQAQAPDYSLPARPSAHLAGVIFTGGVFNELAPGRPVKPIIVKSWLHERLIRFNKANPSAKIAFAAVAANIAFETNADDITYLAIVPGKEQSEVVRIDVDVETMTAVFTGDGREISLKQAPLAAKRTCEQCRRLADQGAYEKSIAAYVAFIENNKGHFQIDDAYFAIAGILDEKLFRPKKALNWYTRLVKEYPASTLAQFAKQRIDYLLAYSDFDYQPLAAFEQIKKRDYPRYKNNPGQMRQLFKKTEIMVQTYSQSRIAPQMQAWLANQYADSDVNKAIDAFTYLRQKWPDHPRAQKAMFDIGEALYRDGQFKKALDAYKQAIEHWPQIKEAGSAQIQRCRRNLTRISLMKISAVLLLLLGLFFFVTAWGGKKGIIQRPMRLRIIIAIITLTVLYFFGAWLIHEQFASTRELVQIVLLFSCSATAGVMTSLYVCNLLRALKPPWPWLPGILAGCASGIGVMGAMVYLGIYFINIHFLTVVNL
ncbi:MAG: tetratricopeptide repeat protein [Desulfobacteraceae bacterium]|nr:tetratricopeptide repeat protein [Desulfobacteraceae bacterium]